MRDIQTQDVFKMARIIKVANLKDELASAIRQSSNDGKGGVDGVELMMILISACGNDKVEKMLYELIGGISGDKPEVIKTMKIQDVMDLLKKIAKENDLENFFNTAVKLA